jgi:ribosomal-protein-alanine N-acetyltransferase
MIIGEDMEIPPIVDIGNTERLMIRSPQEKDLEPITALWTDPDVTRYIGGPRDGDMVADSFRQYISDPQALLQEEWELWWSIIDQSSGQFIGLNAILEKEVEGETVFDLGYFLLPSFWGQGYATEASRRVVAYAFEELNLPSLVAIIDPRNQTSQSVAQKLGMQLERETLRSDGVIRRVYRLEQCDWKNASA